MTEGGTVVAVEVLPATPWEPEGSRWKRHGPHCLLHLCKRRTVEGRFIIPHYARWEVVYDEDGHRFAWWCDVHLPRRWGHRGGEVRVSARDALEDMVRQFAYRRPADQ